MKLLVLVSVLAAAGSAALQGYTLPTPHDPTHTLPTPHDPTHTLASCKDGEILHVDGTCVVPEISRRMFVFEAPQQPQPDGGAPPKIPPPKVHHTIMFVRIPERGDGLDPIVVPPPRQRNVVYVLNEQSQQSQRVVEVPAPPPRKPEVYFVSYDEGSTPTLPHGLDFESAVSSAVHGKGQLITAAGAVAGDQELGYSSSESSAGLDGHTVTGSDSNSDASITTADQDFVSDGGLVSSGDGGEAGAPEPGAAGALTSQYFPPAATVTTQPTGLYTTP